MIFSEFTLQHGKKLKKKKASTQLIKFGKRKKSLRLAKGRTNYEYFPYENNISHAQYRRYKKG